MRSPAWGAAMSCSVRDGALCPARLGLGLPAVGDSRRPTLAAPLTGEATGNASAFAAAIMAARLMLALFGLGLGLGLPVARVPADCGVVAMFR